MSMDISRGSLSSKKQKLLGRQGSDRFSDLPDCVLHYILSFLKTKEVVQTSVLSRRWQYVWTCVASMDVEYSISWMIQDFPVGAHFPYLKKLYLSRVRFMDDLSVKRLFYNCPVLDDLALVHCEWENIQSVTISIPSLKNLYIGRDPDDGYFIGRRFREYICDSHVKFVATNLACLTFSSYLDINFEVSGLSSLEEASMYLPYAEGAEDKVATRILRLFSQINNVEKMTLFNITVETLSNVEASLTRLPTFYNLARLTVDWILYVDCCDYLLAFLEKMPKLEYLDFPQGCDKAVLAEEYSYISDDVRDEIMQKRVPTCFHSSLKTFSIENFEAGRLEIVMIEYVLRNATRLESLVVSSFESFKEDEFVSDAKEYLLKVPRGSESCNIVFSFD